MQTVIRDIEKWWEKLGRRGRRFFFEGGGPKETALLGAEKERAVDSFGKSSLL